ncbi:YbaN family protein [Pelagibacterium limicola]|uniref:YbaN family protein n=1 Tax=Pelagibacterium limicola TaxID=2791022 RepID=UPI0018AF62DB
MARVLWASAGCIAVALAAAGVVLPLLPTTPFLLLAAFCFARGSQRLHYWLLTHRRFGPLLADWQEKGAIAPRAKAIAIAVIVATFTLSLLLGLAPWLLAVQGAVLACAATFVLTRPNPPTRAESQEEHQATAAENSSGRCQEHIQSGPLDQMRSGASCSGTRPSACP